MVKRIRCWSHKYLDANISAKQQTVSLSAERGSGTGLLLGPAAAGASWTEDDAPLSGRLARSPTGLRRRQLIVATSRCLSTFGFSAALCSSVSAHSRSAGRRRDRRRFANAPAASPLLSASLVAASQQTKGLCAAWSQTSARLHGSRQDVWRT